MKSKTGSEESKNTAAVFSNSKKIYVAGKLHSDIRIPFREISLAPTKSMNGQIEGSAGAAPVILHNEPVRVYDTSGPWGDPDFHGDVTQDFRRCAPNGSAAAEMWKKSMGEKFSRSTMDIFPRNTPVSRRNAQSPTLNVQRSMGRKGTDKPNQTANIKHQTLPRISRCGHTQDAP